MVEEAFDILACYFYLLDVHLMFADSGGVDWFECPCAYMEGDEIGVDGLCFQGFENLRCEMQPGSGSGHGAFPFGVDGLVAFVVAADSFAVQVGRERDNAGLVDDFGKTSIASPAELDYPGIAYGLFAVGKQGYLLAVDGNRA